MPPILPSPGTFSPVSGLCHPTGPALYVTPMCHISLRVSPSMFLLEGRHRLSPAAPPLSPDRSTSADFQGTQKREWQSTFSHKYRRHLRTCHTNVTHKYVTSDSDQQWGVYFQNSAQLTQNVNIYIKFTSIYINFTIIYILLFFCILCHNNVNRSF